MKHWKQILWLVLGLLLFVAGPVWAGGWATIEDISMPDAVQAGEPIEVTFAVKQHGKHLVHMVQFADDAKTPVTPVITIQNMKTGETAAFEARPLKEVGYFVATITVPSEGTWEWTIEPSPLINATTLEPLNVSPAAKALPSSASASSASASSAGTVSNAFVFNPMMLMLVGVGLLLAVLSVFLFYRRNLVTVD